ncbi:uncharacterized protein C19orf47 homolog isoform X8 [Dermochelys coriacea]|uniref:uncharacterized protein C19orf47 homolog isoform X8 n=1 Tax=Dermochelys coriacea TaxID=27794 RepID=UPI001CA8221B|nr:uncharacterized protein C19orf47 homolog isoform X8 [Dermochelys coriacea]
MVPRRLEAAPRGPEGRPLLVLAGRRFRLGLAPAPGRRGEAGPARRLFTNVIARPRRGLSGFPTMVSVTMATSEWIQFFKEAGIPPGPAVNYAVMFVDNRIQKNMLLDLNKEIMNELGITVVGDIIAILKHAKVVYRQEMCKAATESVSSNQPSMQSELRRSANSAATRMIANSLSRDSPPATPVRRPDTSTSKISVTVSNKMAGKNAKAALCDPADESLVGPVKRRRVTAEMEGKYIINMPKGVPRTSVFDRLGAEMKADTTTGNKPTGVFSRLGDALGAEEDKATESDDDCSVLQYAGVLKKLSKPLHKESAKPGVTIKAKATSSEAKPAVTTIRRLGNKSTSLAAKEKKPESASKVSVVQRLGKPTLPTEAQDSSVTSTKNKAEPQFRITLKRTLGSAKVLACI